MLIEFGKAGLIGKAKRQPDKVKQVLRKLKTDGVAATLETVFNKLGQPVPLGYCNVGRIVELGAGQLGFSAGQRVVSNGKHAGWVSVPANLCAVIPDSVSDEEAAFTVLAAIALQGIRLTAPTLGENVAVFGLGLIGLLAAQLLRAQGCNVIGFDFDEDKMALARQFGVKTFSLANGADPSTAALEFSRGRGIDAAIIAASTASNAPVQQAAKMCRKRGRIVLVGVVGLELSRADFYEKELSFQVSCSYGPGRYDPNYEEKGQDYPIGFVRWTEQRNFEAVLDMLADGRVDVKPLISHRFPIRDATEAYALVGGGGPSLGIILSYPKAVEASEASQSSQTILLKPTMSRSAVVVGMIGAGNYGAAVLIPAFKAAGARLKSVASSGGVSGLNAAKKFEFEQTTTDVEALLADPEITTIVIATRHNSHARLVCEATRMGKHVFVEKPLAVTLEELDTIMEARVDTRSLLHVGFNRRFAPQIAKMKTLSDASSGAKAYVMTVNAGSIPADHWAHDKEVGGGRLIGEACHFIDLLRFLASSKIADYALSRMSGSTEDTFTIQLRFVDGSIGTVHYFANGSRSFPKERLEIFGGGGILQLDNFRKLRGFGWPGFASLNLWKQDKGQKQCVQTFVDAINAGSEAPIPEAELIEVARVAINLASQ